MRPCSEENAPPCALLDGVDAWKIPELQDTETGGSLTFRVEMQGIDALYERVKDDVEISLDISEYAGLS